MFKDFFYDFGDCGEERYRARVICGDDLGIGFIMV
jgi:hypothetical protein